MREEQQSESAPETSKVGRLPPGKLDIVYRFGFAPFWKRNPDDRVIKPEETQRWKRLSKLQQSKPRHH